MGQFCITQHDGDNGVDATLDVKSRFGHPFPEFKCVNFQSISQLGSSRKHIETGDGGAYDGWRNRIAEQIGPRPLPQDIHYFLSSGGKPTAGTAQRFAHGGCDDIHSAHDISVLDGTAAGRAEKSGGVGVIYMN